MTAAEARHIQAALNRGDAGISLAAGDFSIGQTLTVPFKVGGLMHGVSAGEYVRPRHPHRGSETVLKFEWDQGAEGSSILIEILGAYFSLRDLSIYGPHNGIEPSVGVKVRKLRPGIGAGKHRFSNVLVEHCDVAWQIADDAADNNCDCCAWENPTVRKTTTAWRSLGHQAMQHRVTHAVLQQCDTVLDVRGGGCWFFDDLAVMSSRSPEVRPTILRVEQTRFGDRGRASIGRTNGYFEVRNLKTDHKAGSVRLLDQVNDLPCCVRMIGGKVAEAPDAVVRGNGSLVIEGYSLLGPNMVRWCDETGTRARTPNVTVRDCWVGHGVRNPWDLFDIDSSEGRIHARVENCWVYPGGEPLADYRGCVDAGKQESA